MKVISNLASPHIVDTLYFVHQFNVLW